MVKLSDHRGGSLLRVADLGRKEHLVVIEKIAEEDVGDGRKLVARFEGKVKGLPLNDTNLEALEEAFGPDSNDAIGGQVLIVVDPEVRYGGQRVGGIRIRLPKEANAKGKAAPQEESTAELLDDEIPSDW
jgi:hypothetical protein